MNIVLTGSECIPFAKTGGLADVCGALPKSIAELGHQVCVFLPAYNQVFEAAELSTKRNETSQNQGPPITIEQTGVQLQIPIGSKQVTGQVLKSRLPKSNVTVYLIQQDEYFRRGGLYQHDGKDYEDNCERFVFFCRAILEAIKALEISPDVIHSNDWQTGLVPAYLATLYADDPHFKNTASLMTIHNLAYQGSFWHWDMLLTGIDWKHFNWEQMEFYGRLNLLKTGIVFADAINTVSPTYAEEIQTPEHGCGLQNNLAHRRANLSGILNGIDDSWDPATDSHIKANYDWKTWSLHKPKCKQDLKSQLGLDDQPFPIVGLVGRLASQKGWALVIDVMERWLERIDVQWAVLGTGDSDYERRLIELGQRFRGKLGLHVGFENRLAHKIEAGADMFLMPSRYEPCGLNQIYSLKYGTVPIVRRTGGLADTIVNLTPETLEDKTANGFSFDDFSVPAMESRLVDAVNTFADAPDVWSQVVTSGMQADFSWPASAKKYENLYQTTIAKRQAAGRQLV